MSELREVYEPGDVVLTTNHQGFLYVWTVAGDGFLTLRQFPPDAKVDVPAYPPREER